MTPNNTGRKVTRFAGHILTAKFLQCLASGPRSLAELAEDSGVSYHTVRPFMNALHLHGVVHIDHWRVDSLGRPVIAVYAFGVGTDARKARKKTQAERSRASYLRRLKRTPATDTKGEIGRIQNKTLDTALRAWA